MQQEPEVEVALPEGWTPVESITIWKALDTDGAERLYWDSTDGLTIWEAMGMAQCVMDGLRLDMAAAMVNDDDAG